MNNVLPSPCIGVFDSGVGGLSVLRELHAALPASKLLYVADSGHAPYGERGDAFVAARSLHIAAFLVEQGAQMLVVACNTATAAAVDTLRSEWPGMPIVGIEPGIKPAATLTRSGHIGVMATAGTLNSARFRSLVASRAAGVHVHTRACTGLAAHIETGRLAETAMHALIAEHTWPLIDAGCDVVVLGCTHYAFVADLIAASFGPRVTVIDTAAAVARRAAALASGVAAGATQTGMSMWASGDTSQLRAFAWRWLGVQCEVAPLGA
jgi:glutamate racemase